VYLPGAPVQAVTPLDFGHTADLIESSYLASKDFLTALEITGPGLYGGPAGAVSAEVQE
jgi:NTE family protein